MKLIIADKTYSSWSLRPWLALKMIGEPFEEELIFLHRPDTRERILRYAPSAKVPCLLDGPAVIWESLAICEYLAERFPKAGLWPSDGTARAHARTIASEMHAGFQALRTHLPMNCRTVQPIKLGDDGAARADLARIDTMWTDCRRRFGAGGPFLFGRFTIADAMYAPVATRLVTYQVPAAPEAAAYVKALYALPALQEWIAAARLEPKRPE
jgi:glutathione S-transferase